MLRTNTTKIHAAADMLIDLHGAGAAQYVADQIEAACRRGDGLGGVAWSVIATAVRQRLDGAAPSPDGEPGSRLADAGPRPLS